MAVTRGAAAEAAEAEEDPVVEVGEEGEVAEDEEEGTEAETSFRLLIYCIPAVYILFQKGWDEREI